MKTNILLAVLLISTTMIRAQELSFPPNGNNEKAEVSQWIGLVKVTVTYHSPDVHAPNGTDRRGHIWGELVPFGFNDEGLGPSKSIPWRAGANESTTISFSHDVKIDNKPVKAGTYALFLDVEKEGPWNWILSTNIGWGSYQYDSRYDVIRIPQEPEEAPYTEWLTYGFDERQPNSAKVFLQWENKRVGFKIDVPNVNDLYVDQMRKELLAWPGFNYQNWENAALFCAQNKINLEEALVWADKAIQNPFRGAALGKEDFSTCQAKALVLIGLGREAAADSVMNAALNLPGVLPIEFFLYSRRLLALNKKEKALEVAKLGLKTQPKEKFWTYLALARAYSAVADKKNGIKNWEIAIQNIPESQKSRLPLYQSEMNKLKGL